MTPKRKPYTIEKSAEENIEYFQGEDLFQFWVGPTLPSSEPNYQERMGQLKRVFQSANLIAECVDNWKDGLISQPFTWQLKDKNGERVEAEEAEIQIQRWLDWVNQQHLTIDPDSKQFGQASLWDEFVLSAGVTGQANLRLWQPQRYENDPDPIHQIHLHVPKVGSVEVKRDEDGFVDSITYAYGDDRREIQTFDERGLLTVTVDAEEVLTIDTGGRWLIQQIQVPSLLTDSVKQLQNSVNHSLTMKLRNNELSGFREKTFINAESPDEPLERGPGRDVYLYGIPQGEAGYATPTIHESQPIDISSFEKSIQIDRLLMYLQFRQGHLLATGDGGLSGESRIQMRQSFELFLRGWKLPIESAIGNVLNVVLRLLGYENLEAVVTLNITTGKLSSDERQSVIAEYQAGLLSRATTIAKLGSVDDVDAELAMLEEEMKQQTMAQTVDPLTGGIEQPAV